MKIFSVYIALKEFIKEEIVCVCFSFPHTDKEVTLCIYQDIEIE